MIKSYAFSMIVFAVPATSISTAAKIRILLFTIIIYNKVILYGENLRIETVVIF